MWVDRFTTVGFAARIIGLGRSVFVAGTGWALLLAGSFRLERTRCRAYVEGLARTMAVGATESLLAYRCHTTKETVVAAAAATTTTSMLLRPRRPGRSTGRRT